MESHRVNSIISGGSPPLHCTLTMKGHHNVQCVVCVCFLPIHSGHQVCWTYQPGSHRRKVTQNFSSTFFLRCVSQFSREKDSAIDSFPSSTVKSEFVY